MGNTLGLVGIFIAGMRAGLATFAWQEPDQVRRRLARLFGLPEGQFMEDSRFIDTIPGGTGAQLCALAGRELRGWPGATAALLGYCLPGGMALAGLGALWPALADNRVLSGGVPGAVRGLTAAAPALSLLTGVRILHRPGDSTLSSARPGRSPILWALAGVCAVLFFLGLKPFSMLIGGAVIAVLLLPDPVGLPGQPASTPYRWSLPIGLFLGFAALAGTLFAVDPILGKLFMATAKAETWGLGGFGTLALFYADAVRLRHWVTPELFAPALALAQSVPGPASALAAFAGYSAKGPTGAATAFAAASLSSLFALLAAAPAGRLISSSVWAAKAVLGVSAVLAGLAFGLGLRLAADATWDAPGLVLAALAALALAVRANPALVALAAALAGAVMTGAVLAL